MSLEELTAGLPQAEPVQGPPPEWAWEVIYDDRVVDVPSWRLADRIAAEEHFHAPLTRLIDRTEVQGWLCWRSLSRHSDPREHPPEFGDWIPQVVEVRAKQVRPPAADTPLPEAATE